VQHIGQVGAAEADVVLDVLEVGGDDDGDDLGGGIRAGPFEEPGVGAAVEAGVGFVAETALGGEDLEVLVVLPENEQAEGGEIDEGEREAEEMPAGVGGGVCRSFAGRHPSVAQVLIFCGSSLKQARVQK